MPQPDAGRRRTRGIRLRRHTQRAVVRERSSDALICTGLVVAVLLVFAMALRLRRGFEGSEWFEFLLAAPIFFATLETLAAFSPTELRRFRRASLALLVPLALGANWGLGHGWGTAISFPRTQTTRGVVRWGASAVRDYREVKTALDSIDPTGTRPLRRVP